MVQSLLDFGPAREDQRLLLGGAQGNKRPASWFGVEVADDGLAGDDGSAGVPCADGDRLVPRRDHRCS